MPLPLVTTAVALALGATRPLVPAAAGSSPPTGLWRWPLAAVPVVARPFEPPPGPWAAGHRGVDLAAAPETAVLAAGAGVVSFAGYVAGTGVVAVRHPDGLRTTYEPVLPAVHAGASVAAGELLGHLMPGHGDCGPGRWCLHWGLLSGSTYLDPLTLLRLGPVRLLPLTGAAAAADTASAGATDEAPLRDDVTGFPQTGLAATSTTDPSTSPARLPREDVTRFPETGLPATSTPSSKDSGRAVFEWLMSVTGFAGALAWWPTRSPLRPGGLRARST
jgi:murein DD-endopeptidase MepM/ murein hydrolase activator NlpD